MILSIIQKIKRPVFQKVVAVTYLLNRAFVQCPLKRCDPFPTANITIFLKTKSDFVEFL